MRCPVETCHVQSHRWRCSNTADFSVYLFSIRRAHAGRPVYNQPYFQYQSKQHAFVCLAKDLNAIFVVFRGTQQQTLFCQQLDLKYPDMPDDIKLCAMASIVLIKIQLYILKLRAEHQHPDHV
ncbi:hypothetical protein IGI04_020884 [Brassica rapa subsp. trilocularis]|uniref:Uncharacterized protein n=1 Tax=Brassica rapa subsp. trilocularis TaxID=1813537 RepID=A0ABQ7MMF1_BRACM|nr:hypothetical protein IGI04_020884 [Brassica rapa subsp. trilocularis]